MNSATRLYKHHSLLVCTLHTVNIQVIWQPFKLQQVVHQHLGLFVSFPTHHPTPPFPKLFPRRQILDSSNLEEFVDNYFKFHEYARKFSDPEKNTVGKGEIAHFEQFLLFP